MGRVKRYKKIKACDPFAKRSNTVKAIDYKHDQPPEKYEKKAKRREKRSLKWENDEDRELLLQKTALKELQENKSVVPKIEGKHADETMREFKTRIRFETKKSLVQQTKKISSTAQKRKNHLINKKILKKNKKLKISNDLDSYNVVEEEYIDFNNNVNNNNEIVKTKTFITNKPIKEFNKPEIIQFNERVDRPPDVSQYIESLNKKKRNIQSITSNVLDSHRVNKIDSKLDSKVNNSISHIKEMERLRDQVKQAYQQVKLKRLQNKNK
mmetsp:Transcript_23819/g.21677  ORF Transcript_23819/g.21677 Transcript_23819/m.21677 type:complete len:268 (-) Transcript_23819:82-885(-)